MSALSACIKEIQRFPYEEEVSAANPGFICVVVMVETAWVLDRAYGFAPEEIAAAIERMLQADGLLVENEQEVFAAMIALRDGRGEFADALIGALGAKAGCSRALTFDRKAARLPGFAGTHKIASATRVHYLRRSAKLDGISKAQTAAPPRSGGFWTSGIKEAHVMGMAPPLPTTIATYCFPFAV
jgi:predicted nucleic-acid-binding protein